MTKKSKSEMYEVFAEAFHDVVVPILESMDNRMGNLEVGQEETNSRFDSLESSGDRIERKLNAHVKRTDVHEKDIKRIKRKLSLA